jgi:hypothetical protein
MSKGKLSHKAEPGQVKSGWVNASEPLMRLRKKKVIGTWLTKTMMLGEK